MGCESSDVALEELRPLSLDENDSWRGSDSDGKDDSPEAYMQLYFSSGNEKYNCILALSATRRYMSTLFKIFVRNSARKRFIRVKRTSTLVSFSLSVCA